MGIMGLTDPYLKTTRAKEHLESLRNELQVFQESNPCRFTRRDDEENQLHIISFKMDAIPDKIPLIAGDIFYNLRASLDQLAWCLARLPPPLPSYPEDTQFPILEKPNPQLIKRRTRGIRAEAVRIIESLQPYNGRDAAEIHSYHLWRLNKLCNIDKHMRIPVHGATGTVVWGRVTLDRVHEGFDKNMEVKIPLNMKDEMALDPKVPNLTVLFGDMYWGIQCDLAGIEAIYEFVTNSVIPRFSRFL